MPTITEPSTRTQRKTHLMVICGDYNGHPDVPFMTKGDDFRLSDPRFSGNYRIVGEGAYGHRARTLTVHGRTYHVFSDWSLGDQPKPRRAR